MFLSKSLGPRLSSIDTGPRVEDFHGLGHVGERTPETMNFNFVGDHFRGKSCFWTFFGQCTQEVSYIRMARTCGRNHVEESFFCKGVGPLPYPRQARKYVNKFASLFISL